MNRMPSNIKMPSHTPISANVIGSAVSIADNAPEAYQRDGDNIVVPQRRADGSIICKQGEEQLLGAMRVVECDENGMPLKETERYVGLEPGAVVYPSTGKYSGAAVVPGVAPSRAAAAPPIPAKKNRRGKKAEEISTFNVSLATKAGTFHLPVVDVFADGKVVSLKMQDGFGSFIPNASEEVMTITAHRGVRGSETYSAVYPGIVLRYETEPEMRHLVFIREV